jgi:hypothetical protein
MTPLIAIRKLVLALGLVTALQTTAFAAPGVGEKVYGATVEPGVTEFEARYGRLTGGPADGEDGVVLEVAHGFSKHFYGAVVAEFEREPGYARKLGAVAVEGIVPITRWDALKLDVALYGEYEVVIDGPDKLEFKTLLQHRSGPLDARLNLKFAKQLGTSNPVTVGYAASVDWALRHEIKFGLAAFGNLSAVKAYAPHTAHFIGPVGKFEIEHLPGDSELTIETGYLVALGAARDETKGQIRLLLEWETKF